MPKPFHLCEDEPMSPPPLVLLPQPTVPSADSHGVVGGQEGSGHVRKDDEDEAPVGYSEVDYVGGAGWDSRRVESLVRRLQLQAISSRFSFLALAEYLQAILCAATTT